MIVRSLILAGLFAVFGAGIMMRPASKPPKVDEAWLESQYPTKVGAYHTQPGQDGSTGHTYKMDAETYKTLKPYGIVARVMSDGPHTFDVVSIAGDSDESFHNPLLCFGAQGWKVNWTKQITIPTKTRGDVRATIAEAQHDNGAPQYALYTYEGPKGSLPDPFQLKDEMFKTQLFSAKVQYATFFRFMSVSPNITEADMVEFAKQYLDASPIRPIEKIAA